MRRVAAYGPTEENLHDTAATQVLAGHADSGLNITAAAERLYTSQPGISKQLKLLEQELGVQLFTRKGKSLIAITPAGRDVIARARKITREVQNIRSLAREMSGEQEGMLSIATTHTQARYVLRTSSGRSATDIPR